ncbi:MAG TPA: oxygen-dependent coproporphyrinogen oxidase [Chitinophagales bacterium]|nr:oxygen-dependent coproporphyrinogen oxidase [Chitinophagales bacterium]
MKEQFSQWVKELQSQICQLAEQADGKEKFITDTWHRPEGGGGITRVIQNGAVFEKGGVNISEVYGPVTPAIKAQLKTEGESFFACGISLVIHPANPMAPTVHANFRYFELYDAAENLTDSWFGGGADLTPYILFEEDAKHFHQCFKESCDRFSADFYPDFKLHCDNYFVNHHRNGERRGIGGIFYDYQRPGEILSARQLFEFAKANSEAFIKAYFPIIEKRKLLPFTEQQKHWQLIRRGRYVEFNLIHDRGTIFGLKSNGRTESILMSLPAEVRFEYNYQPKTVEEEKLQQVLLKPVNWI